MIVHLALALPSLLSTTARADEVIFRRQLAIQPDGRVQEEGVTGSTVIEQADGAAWTVTTRDLISPDGEN